MGWAGDLPAFPKTTASDERVLGGLADTWQPWVLANGTAQQASTKVRARIYGDEVS